MWSACASWLNRDAQDFVGFATALSNYARHLLKDGFSHLEFSALSAKKERRMFTKEEAPFDLSAQKMPPWPRPHESPAAYVDSL